MIGSKLAAHAVLPSLVIAATVLSLWNANTSAIPVGLGTEGTIDVTPEPSPGFDQRTVPSAKVAEDTVTSADAPPAIIVTWPAATAVRIGGSSVDRLTTVVSLDVQVSPVIG